MKISVILPTYNRAKFLPITLESLFKQDYPKSLYEILVVDNNSSDNTSELIKHWEIKTCGLVKYHFEARQGSHFARNGVVKCAKGDILYFTDDDMIADKNLLKEIVKVFEFDFRVASVTGRVLPKWEVEPPSWIIKYCSNCLLSLYDRKEDIVISSEDLGIYSCHQAVLKKVFIKVGGYNPDIVNGEWLGDNEKGLNLKIIKFGYKFGFIRSAITYHIIPTSRMTQNYLNKRLANQGNSDSYTDYRKYRYTKEQLLRNISSYKITLLKRAIRLFIDFCMSNDRWRLRRAQLDYYRNRIKYDKRLIYDDKFIDMVLVNDWINI